MRTSGGVHTTSHTTRHGKLPAADPGCCGIHDAKTPLQPVGGKKLAPALARNDDGKPGGEETIRNADGWEVAQERELLVVYLGRFGRTVRPSRRGGGTKVSSAVLVNARVEVQNSPFYLQNYLFRISKMPVSPPEISLSPPSLQPWFGCHFKRSRNQRRILMKRGRGGAFVKSDATPRDELESSKFILVVKAAHAYRRWWKRSHRIEIMLLAFVRGERARRQGRRNERVSEEIRTALNIVVLRVHEDEMRSPEETRRPAVTPGTIPTCENPGAPPRWEASSLTTGPSRPPRKAEDLSVGRRARTAAGCRVTVPRPPLGRYSCTPGLAPTCVLPGSRRRHRGGCAPSVSRTVRRDCTLCRVPSRAYGRSVNHPSPYMNECDTHITGAHATTNRNCLVRHGVHLEKPCQRSSALSTSVPFTGAFKRPHKDATVAERLDCSPPTKAFRVQSPAGSLWILACGNRAGRCHWLAGFLGDIPFSPALSFRRCSILTLINLIGSQHFDKHAGPLTCRHITASRKEMGIIARHIGFGWDKRVILDSPFHTTSTNLLDFDFGEPIKSGIRMSISGFETKSPRMRIRSFTYVPLVWCACASALAVNIGDLSTEKGKAMRVWSSAGMQGWGKRGDPRENPLTSGIVRHNTQVRKSDRPHPPLFLERCSHGCLPPFWESRESQQRRDLLASQTSRLLEFPIRLATTEECSGETGWRFIPPRRITRVEENTLERKNGFQCSFTSEPTLVFSDNT
ncbi:hypothetical protein PR048_009738 [Dryococelus australis]|uniref:Uncharacterized protein n=1 Tax=Dryococelus australis TaxID=614101 RepID=A0ABQ9I1S8_9NEOP|nr:hypothetical protein PR048_009738 [Dryococelus australis]